MRYSEALSLVSEVRAVTVSAQDVALARRDIMATLARWSPRIEECAFDAGTFWVAASGLTALYGSEALWGAAVRQALEEEGYRAVVVVGFTRGGTYVLARSRRRSRVVRSRASEARSMDAAPLTLFPLSRTHLRLLDRLGLRTFGAVAALPPGEVARRFGPELLGSLRQLEALSSLPVQSADPPVEWSARRRLEFAATDRSLLVAAVTELLDQGLERLRRRSRLVAEFRLVFVLESQALVAEVLRPAQPTADRAALVRLTELRLEQTVFAVGVVEIRAAFADVELPPGAWELFEAVPERDERRGAEALALIRARWGNGAVVRPVPQDDHVPELSFRWEEVDALVRPAPQAGAPQAAVRRVLREAAAGQGAGQRLGGPYRLRSVGRGRLVDREYWFLKNRREVEWVFHDNVTGRSFLEGVVD
jgi:protein ImuB